MGMENKRNTSKCGQEETIYDWTNRVHQPTGRVCQADDLHVTDHRYGYPGCGTTGCEEHDGECRNNWGEGN